MILAELDEEELAYACARSRITKFNGLDEKAFQKKLSGLLTRRGFPYHVTRDVVGFLWKEKEKEL